MDPVKVQFVGAPCGQHGPYTFYKGLKYFRDQKAQILSLGEFFFVEILKGAPVSIGELQLLWEDKNNNQLLSSVRLYFLPEHTPDGKRDYHGEDEILALSEKLILKVDDLVSLITNRVSWTAGCLAFCQEDVKEDSSHGSLVEAFKTNNCGLQLSDIKKEKDLIGEEMKNGSTEVVIMSYPQYCRFRTVTKRLENLQDQWLQNAIVSAIGGFTGQTQNCRVMFCRDTFYHPELEDFELRCDHLAPNLKGRPRKKKLVRKESSQDSDSYEEGSDTSIVPKTRVRRDSSKSGLNWDRDDMSKEEQHFLFSLHKFMRSRQTPIERIPSLGFKQIDLYFFYTYAKRLGGYEQITQKRLWKHLYDQLGGHPGSTSAATCTRRHYERLLLAFERQEKGEDHKPLPAKKHKLQPTVKQLSGSMEVKGQMQIKAKQEEMEANKKHLFMKTKAVDNTFLEEKEKQWNEIRKQNAIQRDKLKKLSHRQTVKKMLDKVSSKENKLLDEKDVKETDSKSQVKNDIVNMNKVKKEVSPADCNSSSAAKQKPKLEVPIVRQRTKFKPSILSPLVQRKMIQNHDKSSQHANAVIRPPSRFYATNFPHYIAHPSPSVADASPRFEEKRHYRESSPHTINNAKSINESHMNSAIPGSRPSVIQHTPKSKAAFLGSLHNSLLSSSSAMLSSKDTPPAHSNHLKRSYSYTELLPNSPHGFSNILPAHQDTSAHRSHISPSLLQDSCFSNSKRSRVEPPPSNHVLPSARSHHSEEFSKGSSASSVQDQPFDLSMKTMRKKEFEKNIEQSTTKLYESKDIFWSSSSSKSVHIPGSLSTSGGKTTPLKDNYCDSPRPRSEVTTPSGSRLFTSSPISFVKSQDHHSASPSLSGSGFAESTPQNLTMVSKASTAYHEVLSPSVHPAFPSAFLPQHISPNNMVTPPVHLQHLYATQYASAQMAAYEEMMRQQVYAHVNTSSPVLVTQPPHLYPHLYKDTQKFGASK